MADDVALPDVKLAAKPADVTAIERRSDVIASQARVRVAERVADAEWTDYMPLLLATWSGSRSLLGWGGARPQLSTEIRAPLGYLFGIRSLQRRNPSAAKQFFQDALADVTPDNEDLVRKLVEDELK